MEIYKVYRDKNYLNRYIGYNEAIVTAKNWKHAKGVAIAAYPSLKDNIPKNNIYVEKLDLVPGMALMAD